MAGVLEITDKVTSQWKQIVANIELMKKNPIVKVGVLEGAGAHRDPSDPGAIVESKTVAQVATWNEFGTPTIPKRPAMRMTIEKNRDRLVEIMAKALTRLTSGMSSPETELGRIGLFTVGAMKRTMAEGVPPPNAPSTVAGKRSSKPLIDTGQYRNSITHEVVPSDRGGEGEVVRG